MSEGGVSGWNEVLPASALPPPPYSVHAPLDLPSTPNDFVLLAYPQGPTCLHILSMCPTCPLTCQARYLRRARARPLSGLGRSVRAPTHGASRPCATPTVRAAFTLTLMCLGLFRLVCDEDDALLGSLDGELIVSHRSALCLARGPLLAPS